MLFYAFSTNKVCYNNRGEVHIGLFDKNFHIHL